jgi:hypothetical protein
MAYDGTYVNSSEVLQVVKYIRPDFTLNNIRDGAIIAAEYKIDSILEDAGITTPADDIRGLLKFAVINMYMENMAKAGQIQNKPGEIVSKKMDKVETQYAKTSPMFFFANGGARKFYALLGHETWRMEAYQAVQAYLRAKYRRDNNEISPAVSMSTDNTVRGYNWDQEDWKSADGQNNNW